MSDSVWAFANPNLDFLDRGMSISRHRSKSGLVYVEPGRSSWRVPTENCLKMQYGCVQFDGVGM